MRALIILLLLAAPASAAWDLNNLTPRQRASVLRTISRWNRGYRGRPHRKPCSGIHWGWYVNPNVRTETSPASSTPLTILNPYVQQ